MKLKRALKNLFLHTCTCRHIQLLQPLAALRPSKAILTSHTCTNGAIKRCKLQFMQLDPFSPSVKSTDLRNTQTMATTVLVFGSSLHFYNTTTRTKNVQLPNKSWSRSKWTRITTSFSLTSFLMVCFKIFFPKFFTCKTLPPFHSFSTFSVPIFQNHRFEIPLP